MYARKWPFHGSENIYIYKGRIYLHGLDIELEFRLMTFFKSKKINTSIYLGRSLPLSVLCECTVHTCLELPVYSRYLTIYTIHKPSTLWNGTNRTYNLWPFLFSVWFSVVLTFYEERRCLHPGEEMPHVVVHVIQVTEEVPANCLFKGKVSVHRDRSQ